MNQVKFILFCFILISIEDNFHLILGNLKNSTPRENKDPNPKNSKNKFTSLKSVIEDDLDSFGEIDGKEMRATDNDFSDKNSV